jgi:hypothetical protein
MAQQAVITLHDIFGEGHVLEDLFAPAELGKAKDPRSKTIAELSEPTIQRLEQLFSSIAEACKTL